MANPIRMDKIDAAFAETNQLLNQAEDITGFGYISQMEIYIQHNTRGNYKCGKINCKKLYKRKKYLEKK